MFKWKGNGRLLFPAASPLFCFADLKPRISLALWNLCGVIHEQKHAKCGSHILGLKCDSPESLNILLMKAHSLCHRCLTDVCSFGCSTWDLTCIIYRSYFLPSGFSWRNHQKSYLIVDDKLIIGKTVGFCHFISKVLTARVRLPTTGSPQWATSGKCQIQLFPLPRWCVSQLFCWELGVLIDPSCGMTFSTSSTAIRPLNSMGLIVFRTIAFRWLLII